MFSQTRYKVRGYFYYPGPYLDQYSEYFARSESLVILHILSSGLQEFCRIRISCHSACLVISVIGLLPGPNLFLSSFFILSIEVGGGRLLPDPNLLSFCIFCHQDCRTSAGPESVLPGPNLFCHSFYLVLRSCRRKTFAGSESVVILSVLS